MSNPQDDPVHRPPPPRQGEPQPYQGAPPPPPYQGPPPQPYPQGAPWQGPVGQGAPQGSPQAGYPRNKGLLGHLFDFSFDHMLTPQLIKGAYRTAVLLNSMVAVLWLIIGFWLFQYGWLLTVLIVLFTPPIWVASLVAIRMSLEFLINQFKATEHLKAIREREGLR
ncbi:MAG: hypothetical protein JWR24_2276 [Actinoallomurus sp.]|nr:hypothetical protein [Actinoallomurus sp.]